MAGTELIPSMIGDVLTLAGVTQATDAGGEPGTLHWVQLACGTIHVRHPPVAEIVAEEAHPQAPTAIEVAVVLPPGQCDEQGVQPPQVRPEQERLGSHLHCSSNTST